jgi:hypothetical protein
MGLPVKPLATATLAIDGQAVEYRSLSRAQALKLNEFRGREDEGEVYILMCGTGCTEAEATAFREGNDIATAGVLIEAIIVLSGLAKADPESDADPNVSPPSEPSSTASSTASTTS